MCRMICVIEMKLECTCFIKSFFYFVKNQCNKNDFIQRFLFFSEKYSAGDVAQNIFTMRSSI